MKTIKYNKLIRDKIPQIIKKDNAVPKIGYLSDKLFFRELKKKLVEESSELQEVKSKKELINEMADVLEVIQSIIRAKKLNGPKSKKREKVKKMREEVSRRNFF